MSADEIKNRTVYVLCRKDKPEDGTDLYIGGTSQPLLYRLCEHRYSAKNFMERGYSGNNKLYTRLNEVGLDNWKIIPLITFKCGKKTIRECEKQWVSLIGADLNTYSPFTDQKEYRANWNAAYYKKNKKEVRQRNADYRKVSKGNIRKQQEDYREFNVENKKYHCDVCDFSFGYKRDLGRHYKTLKHSYAYMDSVD